MATKQLVLQQSSVVGVANHVCLIWRAVAVVCLFAGWLYRECVPSYIRSVWPVKHLLYVAFVSSFALFVGYRWREMSDMERRTKSKSTCTNFCSDGGEK
mmetsp:Transcript_3052/g.6514  ORF Transcript_3052/g.6514 Transcript_3052/m.6514 type:complete len:99 (+) Transcript_3052:813-1109(+)